uniref:hypothetical protein n=1 Tax=Rhizobium ruizarguesonis TaxID=2081791 RepID=UPI001FDFBCF2|nr:hypothetical protein [Rhizobium ruizarguesonis]
MARPLVSAGVVAKKLEVTPQAPDRFGTQAEGDDGQGEVSGVGTELRGSDTHVRDRE